MSFNTDDVTQEPCGSQGHPLPYYSCGNTAGNTAGVNHVTDRRPFHPRRTGSTQVIASSSKGQQKSPDSENRGTSKNSCRSTYLREIDINIINDSGSDGHDEVFLKETRDDEKENAGDDYVGIPLFKFSDCLVEDLERDLVLCSGNSVNDCGGCEQQDINIQEREIENLEDENARVVVEEMVKVLDERIENENIADENNANEKEMCGENFFWSDDFSSFTGQKELYSRVPGPAFSSQDPADIFYKIWDYEFMEIVVRETNKYASEVISLLSDADMDTGIPDYLESWTDVTVAELYRYFAVLIFLSFCHRLEVCDYWETGLLGMPEFRSIMSLDRFSLIYKFLHFVSNEILLTRGNDRKIEKVAPIVNHCNQKFAEMYTPCQHLILDECLYWKRRMGSKANRFGIKSLELREAETGYVLRHRLYTGNAEEFEVEMHPEPLIRFQDHTSKMVLDIIGGYLDLGHVLVIDNLYNQLSLIRYLKTRRTDVLGTFNRQQSEIPPAIKNLKPKDVKRRKSVGRHSGDIALVVWKDWELVTAISTYHQHVMVPGTCEGKKILMPSAVQDYNQYIGGVKLIARKRGMIFMERCRNQKWYMKVFSRLLSASLRNAFIIYRKNPMYQVCAHSDFRLKVAEGILRRYPPVSSVPDSVPETPELPPLRLRPGQHFPAYTEVVLKRNGKKQNKRLRSLHCPKTTNHCKSYLHLVPSPIVFWNVLARLPQSVKFGTVKVNT